jgi:CheY-like chemotaxis protein
MNEPTPDPTGPLILHVDDDSAQSALFGRLLTQSGRPIRVEHVRDGDQALDRLGRGPRPDLVLLDLNLPRRNGEEVLRAIRGDPGTEHLVVVVYTSSAADLDRRRVEAAGADGFETKPRDFGALRAMAGAIVDQWLPPRTGEAGPASAAA